MGPLTSLAGSLIGKAIVTACANKVISSAVVSGKKNWLNVMARFRVEAIADNYFNKVILRVITFKTLNGDGKDVKLNDIYYPLKLKKVNGDVELKVESGVTLKYEGCICITGSAGQGKTTIMRKLFVEELISGERFPFFLTLRDVDFNSEKNCAEILRKHLNDVGVECSDVESAALLSSGRVVIFFDGFDEITSNDRSRAIKVIEGLYLTYSCSSVITTRPDTELANLTGLEHYKVKKLGKSDVDGIIMKVVHNQEYACAIIDTLKKNTFLHGAINTPILVSVFIVTYDSFNDEPKKITDFYDAIFISLIFKHDKSKNFKRVRQSGLNNHALEECFSYFSYFSLANNVSTFNDVTVRKFFHEASMHFDKPEQSEDLMYDIINGTNLIVLDGHDRYVYIHRSIQEYFAAKCISCFDEEGKKAYYSVCLHWLDNQLSSRQIVRMLASIDSKSFAKFYLLPLMQSAGLIANHNNIMNCEGSDFDVYISGIELGFMEENGNYVFKMIRSQPANITNKAVTIIDIMDLIAYHDLDYSSVLHSNIKSRIEVYISNYVSRMNISESEFTKRFATPNFYVQNSFKGDAKWNEVLPLEDLFENKSIPHELPDSLASYSNNCIATIKSFLDLHYFNHQKNTRIMVDMLKKKPLKK